MSGRTVQDAEVAALEAKLFARYGRPHPRRRGPLGLLPDRRRSHAFMDGDPTATFRPVWTSTISVVQRSFKEAHYEISVWGDAAYPVRCWGGVVRLAGSEYGVAHRRDKNARVELTRPYLRAVPPRYYVRVTASLTLGRTVHSVGDRAFQERFGLRELKARFGNPPPPEGAHSACVLHLVVKRLQWMLPPDSVELITRWAGSGVPVGFIGRQAFS